MFERFTHASRDVVVRAQEEAAALGHDHIGTEHLLLGVAAADSGVAARVLSSLGVDRERLRAEVEALATHEPGRLDADALASIGIDLEEVRRRAEKTFGPGALRRRRGRCARGNAPGHWPLTPRAKKALELALREALALGDRHIGPEHILLGLVRDRRAMSVAALERCGAGSEAVRAATLAALRDAA